MRKVLYVAYNKRGAVTGRAIRDKLSSILKKSNFDVRRSSKGTFKKSPDIILRFGDSSFDFDGFSINSRESVKNASDKGVMMNILSETEGVITPKLSSIDNYRDSLVNGKAFFRNSHDQIRFRDSPVNGDKYALSPVEKTNEYRIQIFQGKTMGVYEKIPTEEGAVIYKNHNCDFRRIDMANNDNRNYIKGARPMAVNAVNAVGLLFGGVDVIRDSEGRFYVLEVNSSPALNEPNTERFCNLIAKYIEENVGKY